MFDRYERLRIGLEQLADDFDDASGRLPPVYHQLVKSWEQLSDEAWAAFIDANRQIASDDSWEDWRVHPDKVSCSRFWGNGSQTGLVEFLRLASTGFEILDDLRRLQSEGMAPEDVSIFLCTFDGPGAWDESTGYFEWLEAIHETALGCHTTRLHLHVGNWRYDMPQVTEDEGCEIMEKLESDWSDGDSDNSYPLHPLVGSLQHNVMVSSAEAIRIWLAVFNDRLVPIDIGIEESPIYLPPEGDILVKGDMPEETAVAEVPPVVPQPPPVPRWDSNKRTLWVGNDLIKRYPQESKNQVAVLEAFQLDKWAEVVDDPFPFVAGGDKKRLRDTVRDLNRNHETPNVIRFYSAKVGQGIRWELLPPAAP